MVVLLQMQMRSERNVLVKYFSFAKITIYFDCGYIFGKNGIQKKNGFYGRDRLMKILVILKQQWSLNHIGDILSMIIYINFINLKLSFMLYSHQKSSYSTIISSPITSTRSVLSTMAKRRVEKTWKKGDKIYKYFTDPMKWICACPAYICSHFFLCKHLINSVEKIDAIFFKKVRCNPF